MPSIDTRSMRVLREMNRCPSHGQDATSRRAGCRSMLDVFSTSVPFSIARDSFATTNFSRRRWRAYFPILICLFCVTQCTARICSVGLSTPGWTWPQGDIVVEHGKPLRMFCLLNQTIVNRDYPGRDARDLRFCRNGQELESKFVTVINETAIELFIKTPPLFNDMYNCKLKVNNSEYIAVCLNKVVVGSKCDDIHFNYSVYFPSYKVFQLIEQLRKKYLLAEKYRAVKGDV